MWCMRLLLVLSALGAFVLVANGPTFAHDWLWQSSCGIPECTPGVDCKEAFPLAEGYGRITVGGRCSDLVLVVDKTEPDSDPGVLPEPGTLRWAVEHPDHDDMSRTIVFNVSGIIELERPILFNGDQDSHITVAGETAPGGGIIIAEYGFHLRDVHDIIIRHLRFRNVRSWPEMTEPEAIPSANGDGIEIHGAQRISIDHVSVAWATDEGIGAEIFPAESPNEDITVSNSYVEEILWNGDHPRPEVNVHSRAMIASDGSDRISMHHNYMHSNNQRNPSLQGSNGTNACPDPGGPGGEAIDAQWQVAYNWGNDDNPGCVDDCPQRIGEGVQFGQGVKANIVGAWVREGEDTFVTTGRAPMEALDKCQRDTQVYLQCNCRVLRSQPEGPDELWCPGIDDELCPGVFDSGTQQDLVGGDGMVSCGGGSCVEFLTNPHPDRPAITERPDPTMDFITYVLNKAGALPPDHWDRKFRRQYRAWDGELGGIRDDCQGSKDDCGDNHDAIQALVLAEPPAPGTPWTDADGDQIDDAWELANPGCYCIDPPELCDDRLEDCDQDGWTDLEAWLHGRAAELEDAVLFADEFEDWVAPLAQTEWSFPEGTWQEVEGYLKGGPDGGVGSSSADALPIFPGCRECGVSGTVRVESTLGGTTDRAELRGWFRDSANYVRFALLPNGGQSQQGAIAAQQVVNGTSEFTVTAENSSIDEAKDYDLQITYDPSTDVFRFFIAPTGSAPLFWTSAVGQDPGTGSVGFASRDAEVLGGRVGVVDAQ